MTYKKTSVGGFRVGDFTVKQFNRSILRFLSVMLSFTLVFSCVPLALAEEPAASTASASAASIGIAASGTSGTEAPGIEAAGEGEDEAAVEEEDSGLSLPPAVGEDDAGEATPEDPDAFEGTDTPGTPGTPGTPEVPGTPEIPADPEISETPAVPETPQMPGVSDKTESPATRPPAKAKAKAKAKALETPIDLGPKVNVAATAYVIKPVLNSKKALGIAASSYNNSAALATATEKNLPSQRFRLEAAGDGYYFIRNVNSGKVLNVVGAAPKSGAWVTQYDARGSGDQLQSNQQWSFVSTGDRDGSYYIVSKIAPDLVLYFPGTGKNNARMRIYKANKSKGQKFILEKKLRSVADGVFAIASKARASRVLDINAASTANGAKVQVWKSNGTGAQKFAVSYQADSGYYRITNVNSGKSLDVASGSTRVKTKVQQYTVNDTAAQLWSIEKKGSYYLIRSACSGLALDGLALHAWDGAQIHMYTVHGDANQLWKFKRTRAVVDGLYSIKSSISQRYVLDVAGGSKYAGARMQVYTRNDTWAQKYNIKYASGGYYTITNLRSGKRVAVEGGGKTPGTNVIQATKSSTAQQLWHPVAVKYGIAWKSKYNGLYLDVDGGKVQNEVNIQVFSGNGTKAQAFVLESTTKQAALKSVAYAITARGSSGGKRMLDIAGASGGNGAKLQTYASNNTLAQKFKAVSAGNGAYYLMSLVSGKYLDVDVKSRKLQQWARTGGNNQKWRITAAGAQENAYTIRSVATGGYLEAVGKGLKISPKRRSGLSQQFMFNRTNGFKVYIDCGHGRNSNGNGTTDPGAIGFGVEADLNRDLGRRLAKSLRAKGVEVHLNDYGGPYWKRHQEAVSLGCTAFISIHFNASNGWARGTESYIHSSNASWSSSAFRNIIHKSLVAGTSLYDRGKKSAPFAVVGGQLPAVLLEIAFLDNWNDMQVYAQRKSRVVSSLTSGIVSASRNTAFGGY